MKPKAFVLGGLMALLLCATAWADQIFLKNGRQYSGRFLGGNSTTIEFEILGRTESFSLLDVDRIIIQRELGNPPATTAAPPSPSTPPVASTPPTARVAPTLSEAKPAPAPAQASPQTATAGVNGASLTLPKGTDIMVRTAEAIDTDRNRVGDMFETTLEEPITIGSQTIAPRGTAVKGRIAYSQETGRVSGQSELILELIEMNLNGRQYALRTSDYQQIGSSTAKRTATAAGGGAAIGAIIGAIAGGGKGAAIGAGAGAVVGTGAAVMTRGQTLNVPAETILQFKLESPLTIQVQ